jgi:hypothetical protein
VPLGTFKVVQFFWIGLDWIGFGGVLEYLWPEFLECLEHLHNVHFLIVTK